MTSHTETDGGARPVDPSAWAVGNWSPRVERIFKVGMIAFILASGFFRVWVGRYSMDPDGVNYIDLARAWAAHDWAHVVNGYWSPLYPVLLSVAFAVVKPTGRGEILLAHAVNFIILVGALACFEFFWCSLRQEVFGEGERGRLEGSPVPEIALWGIAHALFLWASLDLITVHSVGADQCVAAFVYLIAGLLLRIRANATWTRLIALGIVLGLGYLAKAVMFPLGFCFLAIGLLSLLKLREAIPRLALAGLIFLAVSAPWLLALSHQKGRLTFGDSGHIAYATLVSPGGSNRNWQGQIPGMGKPVHPTRKISDDPPAYEFAEPVGGTYPPNYDPSYWAEGMKATFSLRTQFAVLKTQLLTCLELLLHAQSGLLAGAVGLLLIGGARSRQSMRRNLPLFAMSAAGFGIYALVHLEPRYIGAYVVVAWVAVLAGIRLAQERPYPFVATCVGLGVTVTLLVSSLDLTARTIRDGDPYSARQDVEVAERLERMGARPGDRIAVIGWGSFIAQPAHLKIVAELMDRDLAAWSDTTPDGRERLYGSFERSGARLALIINTPPGVSLDAGWQSLGVERCYVRWLGANDGTLPK